MKRRFSPLFYGSKEPKKPTKINKEMRMKITRDRIVTLLLAKALNIS